LEHQIQRLEPRPIGDALSCRRGVEESRLPPANLTYEVVFYRDETGKKPVAEFLRDLRSSPVLANRTRNEIDKLSDGRHHRAPNTKALGQDLYELRVRGADDVRVLFFYTAHRQVIGKTGRSIGRIENPPLGTSHNLAELKKIVEALGAVIDITIVPLEDLDNYQELYPPKPVLEDLVARLESERSVPGTKVSPMPEQPAQPRRRKAG
jgi:phage-related protein